MIVTAHSHVGVADLYAAAFESGLKLAVLPGCRSVEWQDGQV